MRVDIITLFPELFETFLRTSFVGKAQTSGRLTTRLRSPRDFGLGKHKSVDDTPYGGGSGMVMRVDVLAQTMDALDAEVGPEGTPLPAAHRILLTPQGAPFTQQKAKELSERPAIMLICGRYEGFDERVRALVQEEVSLGDFVMTGGEVAAMAIIEASIRLVPGVLGNQESLLEESHGEESLLEYPQYTRPVEFRGVRVPDVLANGNHAEIAKWRRQEALRKTELRRPDMLSKKGS